MALNNTMRVTLEKPSLDELPKADSRYIHPGPGNNWNDPAFSKTHAKKQLLSQANVGVVSDYKPVIRDAEPMPTMGTESALNLQKSLTMSQQGKSIEMVEKTYVTLEDKILRFYGYFTEAVKESPIENSRTRKITIVYFPADDTVMVQEPRIANSGLSGGTILKRQRAPNQFGDTLSINDLNVGVDVSIFNKVYHIYDCDRFTRSFMTELGIEVGDSEQGPDDKYMTEYRQKKIDGPKTPGQTLTNDNRVPDDQMRSQRFIQDSGKVLRFFGYWDDRDTPGSQLYRFDIRYFVEDDQIAVFEVVPGSGSNTTFMSKRRLPKDGSTAKGVELTFAGRVNGMKEPYVGSGDKYYTAKDIQIGAELNVFGRKIKICDVDPWTREYFFDQLRIDLGEPIDMSFLDPAKKTYTHELPPPTGFGTHADSMASTKSLILKAPRVKDKGTSGDVLRFELKFHEPERTEDLMRVFTLSYYYDDGEVMITEVPIRNTGFTGGKFMKKQLMPKNPRDANPQYFSADDFKVGAILDIVGFKFLITRQDQRSENILAARTGGAAAGSPASGADVTTERLHFLLSQFQEFVTVRFCTLTEAYRCFDKDKDGKITFGELKGALKDNQVTTNEAEVVAVLQQLDISDTGYISYQDLFNFMSNMVHIRKPADIDGVGLANETASVNTHRILRNRVLKQVKERLETRCLNGFEMFRMISTMPRAFKGRRAEMMSLTNGAKDVIFTPVQLRRCMQETLGMMLTKDEMGVLLDFFFPNLPTDQYDAPADVSFEHSVDVKTFQNKLVEMGRVDHL